MPHINRSIAVLDYEMSTPKTYLRVILANEIKRGTSFKLGLILMIEIRTMQKMTDTYVPKRFCIFFFFQLTA